jgi:hypothetical protein
MTFNLLRGRLSGQRPDGPPKLAIGEADAHVFNCPSCSRPLTDGTPKCPGCGTRLIMGVAVRRAVTLIGFGAIVGLFVGGMVTSVIIKSLVDPTATTAFDPADGVAKPVASAVAGPTAVPVATAIPVPPAALSAMRQTAILDARIADDATALSRIAGNGTANDIAKVLRLLSADAAIGADIAPRIAAWPGAETLSGERAAFYAAIANSAHASLGDSISDTKAYRANAKAMLKILKGLPALDETARTLAAVAEVELPVVDLGALRPN